MLDLNSVRDRWIREEPDYTQLAKEVHDLLKAKFRQAGLNPRTLYRAKSLSGIIKKLLLKNYSGDPYEKVTDKAGVRVVVKYPSQMQTVRNIIEDCLDVRKVDDKSEGLSLDRIGYKSIHFDVEIKELNSSSNLIGKRCEIQLRTLCQDLWSDMSHELAYKSDVSISDQAKRRIFCLGAVFEVADDDFSAIHSELYESDASIPYQLLSELENHFYRIAGIDFSRDLSIDLLSHFSTLLSDSQRAGYGDIIDHFVSPRKNRIERIYEAYKDDLVFVTQPEFLFFIERIENDPDRFRVKWEEKLPSEELFKLATIWGRPYEY